MKFKKVLIVSLAGLMSLSAFGLAACGGDGVGSGKSGKNKFTTIQFWGEGDDTELAVFGQIVKTFNETVGAEKKIQVKYDGSHSNYDNNATQLSGKNPPDIVYVPDRQFKKWADAGYLENLTDANGVPKAAYEGLDAFLEEGAIWEQGINRYRFDLATKTSTETSMLWALPKDIGPSVLYYNREYLKEMGIEHISMNAEDAKKASYPEKGYFEKDGTWYFNNQVPMSWREITDLAQRMQREIPACERGYFTEWWFNYGWGVGGDVVEYVSEGLDSNGDPMGYYEFTLDDKTPNWIVKDEFEGTVSFTHQDAGEDVTTEYKAGEVISWADKQTLTDSDPRKEHLNQLPSQYDAFLEFVSLTMPEGERIGTTLKGEVITGKDVSMGQSSIANQSAAQRFSAGSIGMFVGLRSCVTLLRQKIKEAATQGGWMKDNDSWDVAPLPVYKEYDENGNVTVHGVPAGHSGSMGLAIARGSKKKEAAWEFVKYVAGPEGQTAQANAGFCIPNQIEIAKSDVFLQPDQAPKNSQVFVDAAQYETPADWWYFTDWHWIDGWADCLNKEVREPDAASHKSVEELFDLHGDETRQLLYAFTYSSKPGAMKDPNP